MKFLHTSDWHLGRGLLSVDLIDQQERFLDWLLALAQERQVDAVVVAGDVYDRTYPSADAVRLLDRVLAAFAQSQIPVILISGNHDSAVRLGFGRTLTAAAGIHFRTSIAGMSEPVLLSDEHGPVGFYGIPYLNVDAVREKLDVERSHEAVLKAAMGRVLADASERGIERPVVLSHSFVRGGSVSDSERDVRVGGIGDAPSAVFDGATYVALGHLHRPQDIRLDGSDTVLRYSGSPMPFSFGERGDAKGVTIVELDGQSVKAVEHVPVPGNRPLTEVRGTLQELLVKAQAEWSTYKDHYVKAILTDRSRPLSPMEQLREHWPHALILEFDPEGGLVSEAVRSATSSADDPWDLCCQFVEYVGNVEADDSERAILHSVIEAVQSHDEVAV